MILSSACCGILCFIFASQLFQVLIAKSIAFGIHIDGSADFHNIQNPKDAADRYGGHLAAYGMFLDVTSNGFEDNIVAFEASIDNPNSILLLSAMPNGGFDAFTDDKRGKLVSLCKQLNAKGRHIILRFAVS